MKIVLTKGDVMVLICKEYGINYEYIGGEWRNSEDEVYWEGNPEPGAKEESHVEE